MAAIMSSDPSTLMVKHDPSLYLLFPLCCFSHQSSWFNNNWNLPDFWAHSGRQADRQATERETVNPLSGDRTEHTKSSVHLCSRLASCSDYITIGPFYAQAAGDPQQAGKNFTREHKRLR